MEGVIPSVETWPWEEASAGLEGNQGNFLGFSGDPSPCGKFPRSHPCGQDWPASGTSLLAGSPNLLGNSNLSLHPRRSLQYLRPRFWSKDSLIIRRATQWEGRGSFPRLTCSVEPRDSLYTWEEGNGFLEILKGTGRWWGEGFLKQPGGQHSSGQWGTIWDLVWSDMLRQMLLTSPHYDSMVTE